MQIALVLWELIKTRVEFKKTEDELKIIEFEGEKREVESEGEDFEYEYKEQPKVSSEKNKDQNDEGSKQ